jgi:NADH:ubiquinone oxidoreductase subunit 2 (subunit N)
VYYYLYPIVVMFFRPPVEGFSKPRLTPMSQIALALTIIGTLYFGLFPNSALKILQQKTPSAQQVAIQK